MSYLVFFLLMLGGMLCIRLGSAEHHPDRTDSWLNALFPLGALMLLAAAAWGYALMQHPGP